MFKTYNSNKSSPTQSSINILGKKSEGLWRTGGEWQLGTKSQDIVNSQATLNKSTLCLTESSIHLFLSISEPVSKSPQSCWMIEHLRLSTCVANTLSPSGSLPPTSPLHHRALAVVTALLPWEHLFWRRPWSRVTSHSTLSLWSDVPYVNPGLISCRISSKCRPGGGLRGGRAPGQES